MAHRNDRGFILPLAVLLVVILAISGTSFMHHDYLERRMASNNSDNLAAFYLANAGIERARATFKIPQFGTPPTPTWTPVLTGYDGPDAGTEPDYYALDPNPADRPCLCPDPSAGCVIPSFGASGAVDALDIPLSGAFSGNSDDAVYTVRAFNNTYTPSSLPCQPGGACVPETGTDCKTDLDQTITLRALGIVRGEQKLLETTVVASSGLRLINCEGVPGTPCPTAPVPLPPTTFLQHLPGRNPASFLESDLPAFDQTHYEHHQLSTLPAAWGLTAFKQLTGPVEFRPGNPPFLTSRTYYFIDGDVSIVTSASNQVVIFATGTVTVQSLTSSKSILIGLNGITVNGVTEISAPGPYPALISKNGLTIGELGFSSSSVIIRGNMWSSGSINLNKVREIRGITTGINGSINMGEVGKITDELDPSYYVPMPGFTPPPGQFSAGIVPGSWRELE